MNDLAEHVQSSIRQRGLIRRGARVVVAVSGGLDSMTLLHVLHELAVENHWQLTVAHLNHRLRGRSSLADERLVASVAKKSELPVITERMDVRAFARAKKLSLEMAARNLRHDFLARTARAAGATVIALAHHADDQVELFFLRLLRGSGGEGLAGMDWRGPSPSDRRITLVRPFLDVPKSTLRAYAEELKVPYREDASNAWLGIRRNRIRHELLPLLRRHYQPAIDRTVLRVMDILGADAALAESAAKQFARRKTGATERRYGTQHSGKATPSPLTQPDGERVPVRPTKPRRWKAGEARSFQALPVAVQRRVVLRELSKRKIDADFDLVEALRTSPGRPVATAGGQTTVFTADGRMQLVPGKAPQSSSLREAKIALDGASTERRFDGVGISCRIFARGGNHLPRPIRGRELFDADKVGSRVLLRHWRAGDRFQPIGVATPVKLQDIFVNQKIPREQRHRIVLAEAANGEIFWVENLRISERFKLSKESSHRLEWRWKRL